MNRHTLYIGLGVSLTLFAVCVAFATAGLFTVYWMTSENDVVKFGLFQVCVDTTTFEECESIVNFETSGSYLSLPIPDSTKFIACQICVISGAVLGLSSIVSCVIFLVVSIKDTRRSKGPFIATMISAISSVICLAGALLIFGILIHKDVKRFYDLDLSFILTCLAAVAILIGCVVFPCTAHPYLQTTQGVNTNAGIVYSTNPQMAQQPMAQYGVPQQPGFHMGYGETLSEKPF